MSKDEKKKNMVQMKVYDVGIDPSANVPIVFLKDLDGTFAMPIWIGFAEAASIAAELHDVKMPRPITHDLLCNIMEEVGIEIERVEICDLRDNTFYANLYLKVGDRSIVIDARPSDSLALALRTGASVWVARKVLDNAHLIDLTNKAEAEKWSQLCFGKPLSTWFCGNSHNLFHARFCHNIHSTGCGFMVAVSNRRAASAVHG